MFLSVLILFGFWIVLSGKFDLFHLVVGLASSVTVAFVVRPLFHLPPRLQPNHVVPWRGWLFYLPWLAKEIVLSSIQVAKIVWRPKMPISPKLVKFRHHFHHELAMLTLTNSITLTPGTVTLDLENDEYTVHALTEDSAKSLLAPEGAGEMPRRVESLFANRKFS